MKTDKPKPSEAVRAKFNDEALPELINVEGILNLEDPVRRATYNIIKEATRNEIIAYLEELEAKQEKPKETYTELEILEGLKFTFGLFSDSSSKCMGYRHICHRINKLNPTHP